MRPYRSRRRALGRLCCRRGGSQPYAVCPAGAGVGRVGRGGMPGAAAPRRYRRTAEPVGTEVEQRARSTSRSAVSRSFVERTRRSLSELMSRRLDDVRLAVMMIDGLELQGRTNVVALGITTEGVKIPLGLWEGSTENAAVATALLSDLVERGLDGSYPGGAGSLREGMEETLTVTRLGVTGSLKRTLESTNPCESMIEIVRRTQRNVKRWSSGEMALRWTAAGMLEAERQFRKIIGYRELATLVIAIEHDHDTRRQPIAAHTVSKEAAIVLTT